jgi:hypothetical protein
MTAGEWVGLAACVALAAVVVVALWAGPHVVRRRVELRWAADRDRPWPPGDSSEPDAGATAGRPGRPVAGGTAAGSPR